MSGDFDADEAVPTAPGSLLGVRVFDTDGMGRLCGVTVKAPFAPGENIATCRQLEAGVSAGTWSWVGTRQDEHRAGSAGCTCGFWAHTTDGATYVSEVRWQAIIEGYGLVTRGTKGFRAEKARLVALVPPAVQSLATARTARMYGSEGVALYPTLHDALAAHPLADADQVDTSGDFWTRPARDGLPREYNAGVYHFSPGGVVGKGTSFVTAPAVSAAPTSCGCVLCRGTQ